MKFIFYKTLVKFIFITSCVSEICCVAQVVQYSESKEISTSLQNNASLSVPTYIVNTNSPLKSITIKPIATRKRRRRRRKKKTQFITPSTTVISTLAINSSDSNNNSLDKTLRSTRRPRRRRIKPRRKSGRKKQSNKSNISAKASQTFRKRKNSKLQKNRTFALETKSLVLPVVPTTPKFPWIKNKKGKVKKAEIKNTRCSKNNGGCSHLCLSKGIGMCQCFKGFRLAEDKKNCVDINECSINNHGCQMNCTNTIGSYRCHCPRGLRLGSDLKSCQDVNECLLRNGHGPCQDTCENTYGGYQCNCNSLKGTRLGNNLHSCVDVDECAKENGGCSHICINTFGRSFCSCPDELEMSLDFKTCQINKPPTIFV